MGIARIRRFERLAASLAGMPSPPFKGTAHRPAPEPLHCRKCGREMAGRGETAICGRCHDIEQRIAETGSPNKRRINQPPRHARRTKARKGSPS